MAASGELKEQIEQILNDVAKQQNIDNYEIIPSTEPETGDGFSGTFYKGVVRSKDTGKVINVIIKKASPSMGGFDLTFFYVNEISFYGAVKVLDDLQKESKVSKPFDNIPEYFNGSIEKNNAYVTMEDLRPLGYVMVDKTKYLDAEHLEAIFKAYGKFHALSFVLKNQNLEKYKNLTKDYIDLSQAMGQMVATPMTAAITAALNSLDSEKDKAVLEELQGFLQRAMELFLHVNGYKGEYSCLVHGDCWSNNMLFKYSDSGKLLDIKIIDFQQAHENTPIHDLSYFFYSGASKKDFDKLDDYLELYYKSFSEFAKELGGNPDELLPFDVLKREWQEYGLYGVFLGIYMWQLKLIPKEVIGALMGQGAAQMEQQNMSLEEMFKLFLKQLEPIHNSDVYRERTSAILRHASEYGILKQLKK